MFILQWVVLVMVQEKVKHNLEGGQMVVGGLV
jgi:hypothetical protein